MERLKELLAEAIGRAVVEPFPVSRESIEEWDSLAHLQFILAVEEELSVRLPTTFVADLKSLQDLADYVGEKR